MIGESYFIYIHQLSLNLVIITFSCSLSLSLSLPLRPDSWSFMRTTTCKSVPQLCSMHSYHSSLLHEPCACILHDTTVNWCRWETVGSGRTLAHVSRVFGGSFFPSCLARICTMWLADYDSNENTFQTFVCLLVSLVILFWPPGPSYFTFFAYLFLEPRTLS